MRQTIRILYIHTMQFLCRCWQQTTEILADPGDQVFFVSQNQDLEQFVDLVAEMKEVEHPCKQGVKALKWVEF